MGLETYLKMIIALHSKFKFKLQPSSWHLCEGSVQNVYNRNISYNSFNELRCNNSASDAIYLSSILKCQKLNNKLLRHNSYLNKKIAKQITREYNAFMGLLKVNPISRSNFYSFSRGIHTSVPNFQQKPDEKNKPNKDDDDNRISSLLAKAFLWMLTGYMLVAIISLMFPSSSQPEVIRYVSWNEFVHHMLAKGEVEEIIVRPDIEIVTIILHEGAIIKGRRIEHRTFHMNIVDMKKFEEKLREAEARLGVAPGDGVPVIYERGSDAAGKLLASLIVAGILLSLFSRARTMRPPISMDTFVRKLK